MSSRHTPLLSWRAIVLAACALLVSGAASAQWLWIDGEGKKVFSDTAPPPGTPDKNILRRPGGRTEPRVNEPAAAAPAAAGTEAAAAAAPKISGKDEQLEAKKKLAEKQAQDAAEAKKKAEAEQYAKARADNCERAKRAKATFDSGVRMSSTNAKGEREIMDDKTRASEAKRVEDIMRSDCGPLPATSASAPAR